MSGVANMPALITTMNKLKAAIKTMPQRMRTAVARDAAGYLDIEVRRQFNAGATVFDTPRPLGVDGQTLALVKTGSVQKSLGFNAKDARISAVLSQRYARFLVGKYRILPQKLPAAWAEYLTKLVQEYRDDDFEGAKR